MPRHSPPSSPAGAAAFYLPCIMDRFASGGPISFHGKRVSAFRIAVRPAAGRFFPCARKETKGAPGGPSEWSSWTSPPSQGRNRAAVSPIGSSFPGLRGFYERRGQLRLNTPAFGRSFLRIASPSPPRGLPSPGGRCRRRRRMRGGYGTNAVGIGLPALSQARKPTPRSLSLSLKPRRAIHDAKRQFMFRRNNSCAHRRNSSVIGEADKTGSASDEALPGSVVRFSAGEKSAYAASRAR